MPSLRHMRRLPALLALGIAVMLGPGVASSGALGIPGAANFVTTFEPGSFPESLAVDGSNLYTTLGFLGDVVRVTPDGTQSVIAHLSVGAGLITGIAVGPDGALYVADATFASNPAPGVFRVDPVTGVPDRVLTLPEASFPNGIAFHDGYLYVADSDGPIWRSDPLTPTTLSTPWFDHALLAPGVFGFGSNGIAFEGDTMYVAVSDFGRIVSIPLVAGSAGSPNVVAERQVLRSADGIAFDADGGLYIAVNHTNRLYRLDPAGTMLRLVNRAQGLSYPTMPAFGQTADTQTTLYLTSGAFANGIAGIHAFDVGVEGLPLS